MITLYYLMDFYFMHIYFIRRSGYFDTLIWQIFIISDDLPKKYISNTAKLPGILYRCYRSFEPEYIISFLCFCDQHWHQHFMEELGYYTTRRTMLMKCSTIDHHGISIYNEISCRMSCYLFRYTHKHSRILLKSSNLHRNVCFYV